MTASGGPYELAGRIHFSGVSGSLAVGSDQRMLIDTREKDAPSVFRPRNDGRQTAQIEGHLWEPEKHGFFVDITMELVCRL